MENTYTMSNPFPITPVKQFNAGSILVEIERDGETLNIFHGHEHIERGDEYTPIPPAYNFVYKHDLDGYARYLSRIYRGYSVQIETWIIGGLPAPFHLLYVFLEGSLVDRDTSMLLAKEYLTKLG